MLSILNSHFIQYLQIILIVNILYRQLCYLRHLFIFYEHNLPQNITILIIIKIFKKKKKIIQHLECIFLMQNELWPRLRIAIYQIRILRI